MEENSQQIDSVISQHIRGWSLHRLSKVALALLRLAVYEMLFDDSIPTSVSINEAVELAKMYGGKEDAPYINGVLATVDKVLNGEKIMPDSVLGIDTSNYTTSAALLCNGEIVNRKKLLPVRQGSVVCGRAKLSFIMSGNCRRF